MSIPILSARDKELDFGLDKYISIVDEDMQYYIHAEHVPSQSWVDVPIQTGEKDVNGLSPKDLIYSAYLSIVLQERELVHPNNQILIKKLEDILSSM